MNFYIEIPLYNFATSLQVSIENKDKLLKCL